MSAGGSLLLIVGLVAAGWLLWWLTRRGHDRNFLGLRPLLALLVRRRLGGSRHAVVVPDLSQPLQLRGEHRPQVLVVGSGLAGLAAASTLAERGMVVTLQEANPYLGGKVGSWPVALSTGETVGVSHGYHAFFRHYHNLWAWLTRLGLAGNFATIDDYEILCRDGSTLGFADTETVPVLNLIDLMRRGLFSLRDITSTDAMHEMDAFLRYDPDQTPRQYDQVSFKDFAERVALPPRLTLVFNTFSRAFFAEEDRMSMAELIKSFHFYYLSHDGGLRYDYPTDDYSRTLLDPLRAHLEGLGVDVRLGRPVQALDPMEGGFVATDELGSEGYDDVVVATPPGATRQLLAGDWLKTQAPALFARVAGLKTGQRYTVLRLWLDRDVRQDVTAFAITDRVVLLDAVALMHRLEDESRAWVSRHGGSVLELHSYAVPDVVGQGSADPDAAVRQQLLDELLHFFPELAGYRIVDEHLQVRSDFTAFHVGAHASRPGVETGLPGLYLAGDQVALPFPAMLMEAAVSSGLLAANAVLKRHGLRQAPVWSVPLRGVLAGVPEPPKPTRVVERRAAAAAAHDAAVKAATAHPASGSSSGAVSRGGTAPEEVS